MKPINKKIDAIALKYYAGNTSAFAKDMGTSEANIRNYRSTIVPKLEFIIKLKEKFELNFEYLLSDSENHEAPIVNEPPSDYKLTDQRIREQMIPLYDIKTTAGIKGLFKPKAGKQKPIDHVFIPNLPKCDGAIHITGDSMHPFLKSGDIVLYKKLKNEANSIFYGEMYLVAIDLDGEEYTTVKWVQKSDKGEQFIKLVSQNPDHQPKEIHLSKVLGIALIKATIRINTMS